MPAARTFSIWAHSSFSISTVLTRPKIIARHRCPGFLAKHPWPFTRLGMLEAGATGLPSVRFRWTPTPKRGAWRDKATADSKASLFANRLVLLIKPQKCPSMIAWLTCVVKPKSSALTINRFISIRGPWDGDLSTCRLRLAVYRILWHQMNPQANPNESPVVGQFDVEAALRRQAR